MPLGLARWDAGGATTWDVHHVHVVMTLYSQFESLLKRVAMADQVREVRYAFNITEEYGRGYATLRKGNMLTHMACSRCWCHSRSTAKFDMHSAGSEPTSSRLLTMVRRGTHDGSSAVVTATPPRD